MLLAGYLQGNWLLSHRFEHLWRARLQVLLPLYSLTQARPHYGTGRYLQFLPVFSQ